MARSISPPCSPTPSSARSEGAPRRGPRSCCRCRSARRAGASAATTRPGSWRAGVARRLDLAAEPELLLRLRETAHQLALPLAERAGNVRGAFAVEPRRRAELRGRHVAIVDDVMTTGSTAAEIAGVLKQAGAATVEVWVLARTPRPGDA